MPGQTASGDYTLSATFTQNEPASHTTFYDLVFGGSDLDDPTQRYLYFQVAQNGTFLIKERTGDEDRGSGGRRDGARGRPDAAGGRLGGSTSSTYAWPATPCPTSSTAWRCTPPVGGELVKT